MTGYNLSAISIFNYNSKTSLNFDKLLRKTMFYITHLQLTTKKKLQFEKNLWTWTFTKVALNRSFNSQAWLEQSCLSFSMARSLLWVWQHLDSGLVNLWHFEQRRCVTEIGSFYRPVKCHKCQESTHKFWSHITLKQAQILTSASGKLFRTLTYSQTKNNNLKNIIYLPNIPTIIPCSNKCTDLL